MSWLPAAFASFLVLLPVPAQSAPPATESLLDHLTGDWVLHGTLDGKETTHDVHVEWVLKRGYVRIHEVSREKDAKGEPAYEAIVFINWNPKDGDYSCLWLDSTSNHGLVDGGVAHGKPSGDEIPFVFKAGSGRFHNRFQYDRKADSWQWNLDDEQSPGKLAPFARLTLTRKK
jgi:hypothetical protein